MTRRSLLKILALVPFLGPAFAKALATSTSRPKPLRIPYLPKHFPKWNPAVDGLEDAGQWALAIERSRLPDNIAFPRVGQIWESICDCQVSFRPCVGHHWPPPDAAKLFKKFAFVSADHHLLLLGGTADLPAGERIRILAADASKPLHVTFIPLRYDDLHTRIVPDAMRKSPGYHGYELSLKTARTVADFARDSTATFFNEAFRLVEEVT
jgi:hypothetical protein